MTVSVPSVDSAYSAESTDGTLTKSATKTVLFQCSKNQNIPISGAGAAGAVFRDTRLRAVDQSSSRLYNTCAVVVLQEKLPPSIIYMCNLKLLHPNVCWG